jgi:hypothetical protein
MALGRHRVRESAMELTASHRLGWLFGWLFNWFFGWLLNWLFSWFFGWLFSWLLGWCLSWLLGWCLSLRRGLWGLGPTTGRQNECQHH